MLLVLASLAHAGCDAQVAAIASLTPEAVPTAYQALIGCDSKVAEASFVKFLEKASDTDAVTGLVQVAIDAKLWTPAWTSLSKVPDFSARDEIASNIGGQCAEHPTTVTFLQGAYTLRDVEFKQWTHAYDVCDDTKLWDWVEAKVKAPPPKQVDEKYIGVANIYAKKKHAEAVPVLSAAAVTAAGNGGPFNSLLESISTAMAPGFGQNMTDEAKKQLEETLVGIAQKTGPEQAKGVATQLANSGSEEAAASLLPVLYPDRLQPGGTFLYGVASVESGTCSGKKTAFVHYTTLTESGTHWSILSEIESPMRAMKPKLKGCTVDEGGWPVVHTEEPEKSANDSTTWAEERAKEWSDKGYEVKLQKEKEFAL